MSFTAVIAKEYGISPFEVLQTDTKDVIMLLNYYTEKNDYEDEKQTVQKKEERIKVNSKTATGGWW